MSSIDEEYIRNRIDVLINLRNSEFVSIQDMIIIDELIYCYRKILGENLL